MINQAPEMICAACICTPQRLKNQRLEKVWRQLAAPSGCSSPTDDDDDAAGPSVANVALLGLCSDLNSTYLQGSAQAPPVLRAAIACDSANPYAELGDAFNDIVEDHGDVRLEPDVSPHDADTIIEAAVARALTSGQAPLLMGGDHSVTFPAMRAIASSCRSAGRPPAMRELPIAIVHFDAHPDLYEHVDSFMPQSNKFSHASPFARIMESGECAVLCQLGCRTLNPHQRAQRQRYGVRSLDAPCWPDTRTDLWEWLDAALPKQCLVYISIDTDALDPAFAPGVSHYEPGGLTVRQVLDVIHALQPTPVTSGTAVDSHTDNGGIPKPNWPESERYVIGADVVEYNVARDFGGGAVAVVGSVADEGRNHQQQPGMTAMVGAKLLKELAAILHRSSVEMSQRSQGSE